MSLRRRLVLCFLLCGALVFVAGFLLTASVLEVGGAAESGAASSFEGACAVVDGVLSPAVGRGQVLRAKPPRSSSSGGSGGGRGESAKVDMWEWWRDSSASRAWDPPRWWGVWREAGSGGGVARPQLLGGHGDGRDRSWLGGLLQMWGVGPSAWGAPASCLRHARQIWSEVDGGKNGTWPQILAQWDLVAKVEGEEMVEWGSEAFRKRWAERKVGRSVEVASLHPIRLPSKADLCARMSFGELQPWRLGQGQQWSGGGTSMRRGLGGWFALEEKLDMTEPTACFGPRGRVCIMSGESEAQPLAVLGPPSRQQTCFGRCRAEEGWSVMFSTSRKTQWEGGVGSVRPSRVILADSTIAALEAFLTTSTTTLPTTLPKTSPSSAAEWTPACPAVRRELAEAPCVVVGSAMKNHNVAAGAATHGAPIRNAVVVALADAPCAAMCAASRKECSSGSSPFLHSDPSTPVLSPYFAIPPRPDLPAPAPQDVLEYAAGQQAALWTSHANARFGFRVGFDVSVPLPALNVALTPRPPDVPPALLLSFLGTTYMEGWGSVRTQLARLHNGRDVVISLSCHLWECETLQGSRLRALAQPVPPSRFQDLMELSWFCLVPTGRSPGSFRLLESLHAGCLPVFVAESDQDLWIPPLVDYIPWEEFLISVCIPSSSSTSGSTSTSLPPLRDLLSPLWWLSSAADAGDCAPVPERRIGKWPTQRVPLLQLPRVLRAIPVRERLRRRELMLRLYYRYLRSHADTPQNRQEPEMTRPLLLALRTLFDRTNHQPGKH
jgi:Exostosin family